MNKFVIFFVISICCFFFGCAQTYTNTNAQNNMINNSESKISYGMAKKNIVVGKTSQEDVIKLFGSPDNMVLKSNKEIWIYDRFRVETSNKTSSGYGTVILLGRNSSNSHSSTYTKTITLIIDFEENGVVEDFNMRVGGY